MKNKDRSSTPARHSPCGGCPKCCAECVFSPLGETSETASHTTVIVPAKAYGCIKGFGDIVLDAARRLGQMRNGLFHPVNPEGAAFLRKSGNPLARHLAT